MREVYSAPVREGNPMRQARESVRQANAESGQTRKAGDCI
jgi:hypothetical protein